MNKANLIWEASNPDRLGNFYDWIGLELYLAARDCAVLRYTTLQRVFKELFGAEPSLEALEKEFGEHKDATSNG